MIKSLQTQGFMRDPAPTLRRLRNEGPLVRTRIPILGKVWLTTTQAAAASVLKNSENFTVRKRDGRVVGMSWWMPKNLKLLASNMLASDDPDHRRLRSLVDQAFHRREMLSLAENMEKISGTLSSKLFSNAPEVDLIEGFSRQFPLAVICELLGLPPQDRPKFMDWAQGLTRVTGIFSLLVVVWRLKPFTRYIEGQIVQARKEGGSGLIHELVELQQSDQNISDDELVAMVFLLLLAGHETTTHLISGSIVTLFQHPE